MKEEKRIRMRNWPRCDIWLVLDLKGISVSPVSIEIQPKNTEF